MLTVTSEIFRFLMFKFISQYLHDISEFSDIVKYCSVSDLEKLTSQYSLQMQISVIQTKFSR